ncbi:MAG TPA: polysaccharide biosynthesis/export family protein [Bacteroidia bacterium]|jgi:polysaccharide export outer membrane protein|nr:polysaccharide biosynthesis/export family protein [Bacteroidia bacterium]
MRKLLLLFIVIASLSSCRILRPNLMLKTPKDYVFDQISDTMSDEEYRISITDDISLRILSNEGFKLVDFSNGGGGTGGAAANNAASTIQTLVEHDGTIKVPLIGRVKVQGLTMREAEQLIETKFSEFYVGPYVILRVTNKRVSVFPGAGGAGKVIPIVNLNTTVLEALAYAGGITDDGKAYRIKLVRNAKPKPLVYLIDLSTINGLKAGNTVVQANDVIYVEPRPRFISRAIGELAPYLSVFSSLILIYTYAKLLKP